MNFWKLCVSIILFSTSISFASERPPSFCGYFPVYEELYYPIIDQKIIGDASLYPFLNCPMSTFCEYPGKRTAIQDNLGDWKKFFGKNLSDEILLQLIYTEKEDWYRKLEANESIITNGSLAKNIDKKLQKPFAKYMLLAKQCEGISSNNSGGKGWYQGEYDDSEDKKPKLLALAIKNYQSETNEFLKNRYGYQIVRLAHYLQKNELALQYFENFLELNSETPYIYYLALEQRSGAAYNLGYLQVATKGFLEVYSKVPSRRENCALSLKYLDWADPKLNDTFFSENGYTEIESFFKSYYLNGSTSREMQRLLNKNPNSSYLEVLAIREVDKLQNKLFDNRYYGARYNSDDENNRDSETLQTLQEIAISQIENEQVLRKDFWRIVLSATYLRNKEYKIASVYASEVSETSEMYVQAKRLSFAIEILMLSTIKRQEIARLYNQLQTDNELFEYRPLTAFFFNSISDLYAKDDNIIVSILGSLYYGGESSKYTWNEIMRDITNQANLSYKNEFVDDDIIQKTKAFIDLPNKTEYEKLIISKFESNPQDYVNELRGTWYFQQNKLEKAISYFEKIGNQSAFYGKYIRPEMFSGAVREYFNVPFADQSDKIYLKYESVFENNIATTELEETYPDNKLKLAQTFQKLEKLAKNDPKNAADYYYMLGNAWYNISERGWFLNSLQYLGNNQRNHILNYDYYSRGQKNEGDSKFAKTATAYFQKALEAQGDKEIKAKATFMLAKTNYCFTEVKTSDYKYRVDVCGDHKEYFKTLSNDYSDTAFEALIVKECSWYRSFLENR